VKRVLVALAATGLVAGLWLADRSQTRRLPLSVDRPDVFSRVETTEPLVALSFDDGPHPDVTPRVLELLSRTGTRATFFVIGRNADARPELLALMGAEGHEIANHTWSHQVLTRIRASAAEEEIRRGATTIRSLTGLRVTLLRPPQGSVTDPIVRLAGEAEQRVVLWSVALDEGSIRDQSLADEAARVRPGDIILAHDVCPPASREDCLRLIPRAVARLQAFIEAVRARGFRFVTVSDLIAAAGR
jgi:peptidoglycan/xylan/chitin deacetylase (PgdA/CDA1 family)